MINLFELEREAKQGKHHNYYLLGRNYMMGINVVKDIKRGYEYYK